MPPKEEKKEKKIDYFIEFGFVGLVILFIYMLWSTILDYLVTSRYGSYSSIWQRIVAWLAEYIWPFIIVLCVITAVLSVIGIVYNYRKLKALEKEEQKIYGTASEEESDKLPAVKNERWEHVLKHINSPNAGDWRLAVIEADVILDELLRAEGYHGDSVGDMLKGVDKADMLTLEAAWEAHKTRNQIAHAGSDYLLNERDAKRVISLYESVFREFEII